MDLEQTIDAEVYRKKALDLDSPERHCSANSYADADGIIEDLDRDWGATVRCAGASPAPGPRQVLPFRCKQKTDPPTEF